MRGAPVPAGPSRLPPRSGGCGATPPSALQSGVSSVGSTLLAGALRPPWPSSSPSARGRARRGGPSWGPPYLRRRPSVGLPWRVRLRRRCGQKTILSRYDVFPRRAPKSGASACPVSFEPPGFALARSSVYGTYDVYDDSISFSFITRRVEEAPSGLATRSWRARGRGQTFADPVDFAKRASGVRLPLRGPPWPFEFRPRHSVRDT
jgi:hypothetical protein